MQHCSSSIVGLLVTTKYLLVEYPRLQDCPSSWPEPEDMGILLQSQGRGRVVDRFQEFSRNLADWVL